MSQIYFFGVWPGHPAGHNVYTKYGAYADKLLPAEITRAKLDGHELAPPGLTRPGYEIPTSDQIQGAQRLHQVTTSQGVWTVLAIWDRTGDRRFGSLSSFVVEGIQEASEVWRLAEESFPQVVARIRAAKEKK